MEKKSRGEVARRTQSERSNYAMLNEMHELCTESDLQAKQLKDARDNLEDAEDDKATLSRTVQKPTSEQARLEKELADAQDNLRQIGHLSCSTRPNAIDSASQEGQR